MPGAHFSLVPRAAQRSFQSPPFLVPVGIFSPRFFLERVDLDLDGRGSVRMLALSLVKRRLRLIDDLLSAFTLLLPGGSLSMRTAVVWNRGSSACSFGCMPYVLEGASGLSMVTALRFPPTMEIDLQRPDFRIVGQASTVR
jgi:hypothetical protein